MNIFMTKSGKIMDSLKEMLLQILEHDRCNNDEVLKVTSKYKHVLPVFDGKFGKARLPSLTFFDNDALELQEVAAEGMRLWQALDLSIMPKPHCIEYH